MLFLGTTNAYSIAKLLNDKNEIELFKNIFDTYELLRYYNNVNSLYFIDDFKKIVVENEKLVDSILNCKEYPLAFVNGRVRSLSEIGNTLVCFVNLLINVIYDYAIKNYIY